MSRYVCIHGHFYQPPRENPWLELIEIQESAAPWHDWNERITAQCYRRNTASRILDGDGNITKICNNYSRMSFNIGPTLLSWMKDMAPRCYRGILEADAIGLQRFSGHGPAIAQVYSHLIMPLANRRDKVTQVRWGIRDFKCHFGRMPEGMWLAETAVDTDTLEVLAENEIRFTILAPKQASEVRRLAGGDWQDVKWERVDTSRAYRCDLPSGRSIAVFFYDGGLSQAIAFGGLLNDGGVFARRLIDARRPGDRSTLSHVATDGESYGHHHDHGDMALAYCLETIDNGQEADLTIYGEFLEKFPPEHTVRIVENSSWSCAHGVERWRSDCGCSNGTPGYHQKWRTPLREALDHLRDKLSALFDHEGSKLLKNPWQARDDYIDVILDRSHESVGKWMERHAAHPLSPEDRIYVLKLMEMQRCAILMYTSCGWFFDEISGLETTQILRYAARAISLARELTGLDFEMEFSRMLAKAPSNVPELDTGSRVYDLLARPSQVSFERLAAHYGMVTLFPEFSQDTAKGSWEMTGKNLANNTESEMPNSRAFSMGEVEIDSRVTWEEKGFVFAANYRGNTSVVAGVAPNSEENRRRFMEHADSMRTVFAASDDARMVEYFGHNIFSLRHILRDAQRALLDRLLKRDIARIETSLRGIVKDYEKLFEYLTTLGVKAPSIIRSATSIILTADIIHALEEEIPDIGAIERHINRARQWDIALDNEQIGFALSGWLMRQMQQIHESPTNPAEMERISDVLTPFMDDFKWHLSLYEAQNLYYTTQSKFKEQLRYLNPAVETSFRKLGRRLKFSEKAL